MRSRAYRRFRQTDQERAVFFGRRGIARFAAGLMADSAARCTMIAEYQTKPGDPKSWEPVTDQLHYEILARYRNATEDPPDLVRARVWHDQVAGECLQCVAYDETRRPQFRIRSSLLADFSPRGVLVRELAGGMPSDGTAQWYEPEYVTRLWNPDAEQPLLAQSPTMAALEDLEELWSLSRRDRRTADSALAMNGLLWAPSEADAGLPPGAQPGGPGRPRTKLQDQYYEVTKRRLEDDDDVAGYAPLLVTWAGQHGAPQFVEIPNALDEKSLAHRQHSIENIARDLNYPARLLVSGVGEGNHWSDWLLQPEFARSSLAPILERVLWRDLTKGYYRRALRALNAQGLFADDPERYRVGFDMAPVIVRPDQSARSVQMYLLGLLAPDVVLESNGFDHVDAPTKDELATIIQVLNALGQGTKGSPAPPGGNGGTPGQGPTTGIDAGSVKELPPPAAASVRPFASELVGWLDS